VIFGDERTNVCRGVPRWIGAHDHDGRAEALAQMTLHQVELGPFYRTGGRAERVHEGEQHDPSPRGPQAKAAALPGRERKVGGGMTAGRPNGIGD
jgi:hypothetical protein